MIGRLQDNQFYQLKSRFFVWIHVVIVTFEPRNFSNVVMTMGAKLGNRPMSSRRRFFNAATGSVARRAA
jgi:hypothetical protein